MKNLWNKQQEVDFFQNSRKIATPEQLFYRSNDKRYLAYWPKGYEGEKTTLQSRNAFIGNYTEKWCSELLKDFATKVKGNIVQDVVCEEIGLTKQSPADVALCKTKDIIQNPENIILILEVKMSVVWNWELKKIAGKEELICLGDYNSHQGNPSLLRSDTMLKAIGKSINIRVSSYKAAKIPIVIIGNTPITNSYYEKVDHLKKCGIIQGFWSINPKPLDREDTIKNTRALGFYRFDSYEELDKELTKLLKEEREFFSSMQTKTELGKIIEIANKEDTYEKKAEKFLELIRK
ncbi:MAG: hypothetical protein NC923_04705 [Candidatus Omnitrophica bacterium]|nr:hypothetical protein [Candidatus Omnitrophota bacterium]